MIRLRNYWRESSPNIKKVALWLKAMVGTLALSAYAQSEVRVGFCLLLAGGLIDGLLQLIGTEKPTRRSARFKRTSKLLLFIPVVVALASCRSARPQISYLKTDTSVTQYKAVAIPVKGALVSKELNLDSLVSAAAEARKIYVSDSSHAAQVGTVAKAPPPKKQFITDPESKAQLSYWIDQYGRLQVSCESKDQQVQTLVAEVTRLKQEVTQKESVIYQTPKWNYFALATLTTLLLMGLIGNLFNRSYNSNK